MRLNLKSVNYSHPLALFLFLILSFFTDFIDKVCIFYKIDFIKLNRLLKIVFLIYSIGFCITYYKFIFKKIKFVMISLLILSIVFFLKGENYNLYKVEFLRYIILFISFPLLFYVVSYSKISITTLFYSFLKYIIILNAALILLGILFDIQIFKTYNANRFGFNGILLSQGFTPFVYLCASIMFWHLKDKLMLLIIALIALVSGIKGVYMAEFMAMTLIVFCDKTLDRTFKVKSIFVLFFVFILVTLVTLSMSPFKELIKSGELLTAIFSYRTDNLVLLISELTKENFNVLIGATRLLKIRLELQLVDIVLFFGVIGLMVYTYFVFNLYKIIRKNYLAIILLVTALTTSFFTGNLFYLPLASLLLILTLFCLNEKVLGADKQIEKSNSL
jgi:hypothetical protein